MPIRKPILVLLFAGSSATLAADEPSPVQVVAQLYRDFAWEAVIDSAAWNDHRLLEQPHVVLERYFDPRLAALIVRDRECVARTKELCELDFSPIWASQDRGPTG